MLAGTYAVVTVWWWGGRLHGFDEDGKEKKKNDGKRTGKEEKTLRNVKVLWAVPVVYGIVAGVEAVMAGSVVGLM